MMPQITFIDAAGEVRRVDIPVGATVMRGATSQDVAGIIGDCQGNCACATCHVYVAPAWRGVVGESNEMEQALIDFLPLGRETSRLSCQITVTDAMEGLILETPASQY